MATIVPFYDPGDDEPSDETEFLKAEEPTTKRRQSQATEARFTLEAAAAYESFQGLLEQISPACRGVDSDIFFPGSGASTKEAKAICAHCSARVACLEYALEASEKFGIWGGTSERERRRLRQKRAARKRQQEMDAKRLIALAPSKATDELVVGEPAKPPEETRRATPVVAPVKISEEEADWFKKLTGDKSRSEAIYAGYKSGTHLAKSDQPRPLRRKRQPIDRPLQRIQPSTKPQGMRSASANQSSDRAENSMYTPNKSVDERVVDICIAIASKGGKLEDEKGFVRSQLKALGLDYNSLSLDLNEAEDEGLIWRDMNSTRTFVIKLTDKGRQLAELSAKEAAEVEKTGDNNQATDDNSDNGQAQIAPPIIVPLAPEPASAGGPDELEVETHASADQLVEHTHHLVEDMTNLAHQIKAAQQRQSNLEKRCETLEVENARLRQLLRSFHEGLQEALSDNGEAE